MFSKKLLLVIIFSGLSIISFGVVFSIVFSPKFSREEQLKIAARWLDNGRWDVAGGLAEELKHGAEVESDSLWHYIKGVSQLMRIMDDLDSYENRIILSDVIGYLKTSSELGFPLGYRGKGNYFLGVCLFHTYDWDGSISALTQSLADYPLERSDSLRMICSAHLRKPIPNARAAEATLKQWMEMPGLSEREMSQIRLAQAQLAMHQSASKEARKALAGIPSGIPEYFEGQKWEAFSLLQQAVRLSEKSDRRQCLLNEAQGILQRLISAGDAPHIVRRQAYYLSGRTLRYQGDYRRAISIFSGVRQQNPFSAEAIAAGLEEAEILMELERYAEVVGTTRHMLNGISDIRLFNEYWLPEDELRRRLIEVGNRLQSVRKYELALELADQLTLAFPPSHALRLQANILTNWASTIEPEDSQGTSGAREIMTEMFARAGEKLERLAQLEMRSRDYLNIVWGAAENYQRAGRLRDSGRMLELYLLYESRTKRPRGLLALGRNYMALGKWRDSLEPLQRCLTDYPNSPSSYEARFLAARVLAELNDLDQAIDQLSANLWDFELHPESPIWKDSFVELGRLIFQRGSRMLSEAQQIQGKGQAEIETQLEDSHAEFIRAIDQLSESAKRYPDDVAYNQTRYLLARSYQLAAQLPQQAEASSVALSEPTRRQLRQRRDQLLEKAANEYHQLHKSLVNQRVLKPETLDPAILRSAYFGEADMLFELGRYDDAIEAYRNAASYYSNQPEALEALARIAESYRKTGRESDAKKTIRQAEMLLERIPPERDAAFVAVTRGDRQHWQQVLGVLREWN